MPDGTNLEVIWDQNRCQDHFRCRTTLDDAHTSKSPSDYSAACVNHRKPRGSCCVNTQFYFRFHNTLSAKHVCFLVNSVHYFLQISLKSSRFFFLEKYQETCAWENRINKIQTSTGLYKSISVCLMTKKIFQIIFSSFKS